MQCLNFFVMLCVVVCLYDCAENNHNATTATSTAAATTTTTITATIITTTASYEMSVECQKKKHEFKTLSQFITRYTLIIKHYLTVYDYSVFLLANNIGRCTSMFYIVLSVWA